MTNKNKFATGLLATALLSYGFHISTSEEPTNTEPEPATEATVTKESSAEDKAQDIVEIEFSDTSLSREEQLSETPSEELPETTPEESPPLLATEPTPLPTSEPQQTTSQTNPPSDTSKVKAQASPPETLDEIVKSTQDPVLSSEIQNENVLHEILNNTYEFQGEEIIYTENSIIHISYPPENQEPVYVEGFGWVEPSTEPSVRIQALDMVENGNKVGSMGGG